MIDTNNAFLDQLRLAFPPEPIHGETAFSLWGGSYPDAAPFEQAIDRKTWEQLDPEYIVRRSDALGFLSTEQLIQILPLYLSSVFHEGVMSPALDSVLVKLTPPHQPTRRARFDTFVNALSKPQRAVIVTTLQSIVDRDPDGSPGRTGLASLDFWKDSLSTAASRFRSPPS